MEPPPPNQAHARAPGKIILSGEHAVVHGRPALVMAIDRYAEAFAAKKGERCFALQLTDLQLERTFDGKAVHDTALRLQERYDRFLDGDLAVRELIRDPFEPLAFAIHFVTRERGPGAAAGMSIRLRSGIPIGCGMGSSAAISVSALRAMASVEGIDLDEDAVYRGALEIEKLQHGRPSGVDPYVSTYGGFIRFREGAAEKTMTVPVNPLYLVNTGPPQSTTGECVMRVTKNFGNSSIWDEFEAATLAVEEALTAGDVERLGAGIRANHQLLTQIGVVPEAVGQFITAIEASGGAGKICGAGSIAGDRAGVVLVASNADPAEACRLHGYTAMHFKVDVQGVRLVQ